ncbi:M14 family metallopeptidase [Maricaulis sp. CAU 1757]
MRIVLTAVTAIFAIVASVQAQPSPLDARYDPAIPGPVETLGHAFGAEITGPEAAVDYLYALAEAAPERMMVREYARSWQGRPLVYAAISSADNMARLDRLQANLQSLADPRGLTAEARNELIEATPAVVWLSYGVHGDEISSTDAGLRTAYHLLAAQDDPVVQTILENTIVIIDPTQNPDGRARFLASFSAARGLEADDDRYSAEHDQPWPGGRYNHYLFDLNRDWFTRSQPETRGRVEAIQNWYPVVLVDAHEMGGEESYFFAPAAEPFNPNITAEQRAAQERIGRNHARWFDRLGYDYFTREVYDAFYPGYGDMWPTLQGAIAMTYEQGSARGLAFRRRNGEVLTYGDGVDHHFVASLSTAQVVAENKARFLSDFVAIRGSAGAVDGPQAALLDLASNRWGAERMARNLAAQGIEVGRTRTGISACGQDFPDGALLVRYDQPAGRLARTLLEPTTSLPADFLAEQERRREAGLDHQLYDVTAWSLPLMANVGAVSCGRAPSLETRRVDANAAIERVAAGVEAQWGYAIPWHNAGQARLVVALAREGVPMRTSEQSFRMGGRDYPAGSVLVPRHTADDGLDALIERLAAEIGAEYAGLADSWAEDGPNPGSSAFRPIEAPRVAMLWDDGTSPTSAGATRYVLERRYGLPVAVIRTGTVGYADLGRYDVLILPESGYGGYEAALGGAGREALEGFVSDGGVLVALGTATRWLAGGEEPLLAVQRERAADTPREAGRGEGSVVDGTVITSEAEAAAHVTSTGAMPDTAPGALVRVEANENAWMSAGYANGAVALVTGSDIYAPVPANVADTAMRFAGPDTLVAGGHLWSENAEQLAFKPFVLSTRHGHGQIVAFTQSPTTRAYLEGLDLLLLNAVVLGPTRSRRFR